MADIDVEPEYEVERILVEQELNGRTLYLVKWKDYGDEECTWEPRESFNLDETIDAWTQARDKGDTLDDATLGELQARMNVFQNKANTVTFEHPNPDATPLNIGEGSTISMSVKDNVAVSPKSPRNVTSGQLSPNVSQAISRSTLTNRPSVTNSINSRRPVQSLASESSFAKAPPPTIEGKSSKGSSTTAGASRAGQKFRSLSHQNNYRKKARDVDSIIPVGLQLISPDALPAVNDTDTAHILPPGPGRSLNNEASWMFVSEDSQEDGGSLGKSLPTGTSLPATDRTETGQTFSKPAFDSASGSGSTSAAEASSQIDGNRRIGKPEPIIIRAQNGREWFKDDVMISLSMGKAIGDVKFAYMPWSPYSKMLVSLKLGAKLTIDFNPENVIDRKMYNVIFGSLVQRKVIGLVEPFLDTESSVNEFTAYLEKYDSAGLWVHPANESMSMILYSCDGPSWRDIGKRSARIGQPYSKLHFAVFPRVPSLPTRENERSDQEGPRSQSESSSATAAETKLAAVPVLTPSKATAIVTAPTTAARSTDPRLVRRSSLGAIITTLEQESSSIKSPRIPTTASSSTHVQPLPMTLSNSTSNLGKSSLPSRKDQNYEQWMQNFTSSSIVPELTLDFQALSKIHSQNSNVGQKNVHFYICFTRSHPLEAALLNRWLQGHMSPRFIYSDADPAAWTALRQRVSTTSVVMLFHSGNPSYFTTAGLGEILNLDTIQCYSLMFNSLDYSSTMSVTPTLLFPRGSVFLVTESNIVESPQQALFITNFFAAKKKQGWMIVFRPRVRSWLKNLAAEEKNEDRQQKLFRLLAVIDEMSSNRKPTTRYFDPDEDLSYHSNDGSISDACLISPSSLPGHRDNSNSREAMKSRDRIVIEYFCGFAAMMAPKCRRFWVFNKEQSIPNSDHVFFEDPERFVRNHETSSQKQV